MALWFLCAAVCACGDDDPRDTPTSGGPGSTTGPSSSGSASTGSGGDGAGGGGAASPSWETLAPIAAGELQENAVVATGGEVYVIGGFDVLREVVDRFEAYDPASDSWRTLAALPTPRHHVNAAAHGGKIYMLGGLVSKNFDAVGDSYVYDPATSLWAPIAPMPSGTERGGGAIGVIGDKIYVAGGYRGGSVNDFSSYDTQINLWETLPALSQARDHLVGGAVDGVFYALGGRVGGVLENVDLFDPQVGQWQPAAPMITPRAGCAAAIVGTSIFVIGGEGNPADNNGIFDDVEAYDTANDTWTAFVPMKTPRHGTGAAAVNGVIYMPGGAVVQGYEAVDVNEALTP